MSTGRGSTTASIKARRAPWPGSGRPRGRRLCSTGSGGRPWAARSSITARWWTNPGEPRPFYAEVKQMAARNSRRSRPRWPAAHPSGPCGDPQRLRRPLGDPMAEAPQRFRLRGSFRALLPPAGPSQYPGADIISPERALKGYKLVIAPAMHHRGRTRSGRAAGRLRRTRRPSDAHHPLRHEGCAQRPAALRQPGPLAALAGRRGGRVLRPDEAVPVKGDWFGGVLAPVGRTAARA